MPGSEWDANHKAGRDNTNYSPYHTPDGVTDSSAYHAGGKSIGSWATWREQQKSLGTSGSTSASTAVAAGSGEGAGSLFLLLLILPLLVPPGIVVLFVWGVLSGLGWGIWYKIAGAGAVVVAMFYVVQLFYRITPSVIAASVTAVYATLTYGWAASYEKMTDGWRGIVVIAAGTICYFAGEHVSASERGGSVREGSLGVLVELGFVVGGAAVFLLAIQSAFPGAWPYWISSEIRWIGATFAVLGILMLIGRYFVWLAVAAVIAGAGYWFLHPDLSRIKHATSAVTSSGASSPTSLSPAPSVSPVPPADNQEAAPVTTAYDRGVADWDGLQSWFHSQTGARLAGAQYYAAHRSAKTDQVDCSAAAEEYDRTDGAEGTSSQFVEGCLNAKAWLDPIDERRRDPDYRSGFNAEAKRSPL